MTDCTSPDWLQDAINAIQDLDTAQDLVDGVASLEETNVDLWANVKRLDDELCEAVAQHASLQQENERLREFARWVGDNYHVTDWPFASINANAVRAKLDALLTGGE